MAAITASHHMSTAAGIVLVATPSVHMRMEGVTTKQIYRCVYTHPVLMRTQVQLCC